MMKFVAEYYLKVAKTNTHIVFEAEDWEMAWIQAEGYEKEYRKLMNVEEIKK